MPLSITKINTASTQVSFEYLNSDHVFGLLVTASYSFNILNTEFSDGDDQIVSGIEALEKAYSRPNISAKIGVDEFRNGVVKSISFPDVDRVRESEATITIEERIRPKSNDGVLSELFDNIPSPQDVESFSESFNFSRGQNSYSYSRNVSLKYRQDAGDQFFNKAYLFLKNIYLGSRPQYGFQVDGISEYARFNLNLKPLISEFYDELNKEVRLTENFTSSRIAVDSGITFSKKSSHSLSLDKEGYSNKNYNLEIKALEEPLEINLTSGIELSLSSLIEENTGEFGTPFSIEKTINSDGGIGSLSVLFTNDPQRNSITNIDYNASKSSRGQYDEYDFDLNIISRGKTRAEGFNISKIFFSGNRNLGYEKIPILFPEITSGGLNESSRSVSFNPFQRSISENIKFSTNPSFADSGDGILFRDINISENKQIKRSSIVPVLGSSEIVINNNAKKVGTKSVSINVVSKDPDIVNQAFSLASGEFPEASFYYLTSQDSTLEPLNNKVSARLDFTFFE